MVLGISFIALALAISGLCLAFNFFGAASSHLSRPPISAIEDATLRGSLAAVPSALSDEPLTVPKATPSESETVDPPAQRDEALAAPTATPSGPPDPQRGTNLASVTDHTGTFFHARPAHARGRSVLPERCQAAPNCHVAEESRHGRPWLS
jgi:hypothetical protein